MADIFEIVGKISLDGVDKAEKELNGLTDSGEKSSSKLSKFGKVMGTVGKGVVAVGTAVGTASVALVKGVSSSYGELQQNLGGSEAVFGQYANNIQKIGQDAYKNMGISQSQFLATANKMGSLLQGSGISQRESLDMTAKAMQRASDVASVMGIDMEMAMESITGACKGNFTMMDNLGVAMNATTLEAYAHSKGIEDFTWKTATQAEKNSLAMQMFLERTEQYAGNFARESVGTISGSIGYLSASWQDFMAGLGNPTADMARLTNNLAQSFGAMVKNITPIVENVTKSLPTVLDALIKSVGSMLPTLLSTFSQLVITVITNIGALITQYAPMLIAKGKELFTNLSNGVQSAIPQVLSKGLDLLDSLANFLTENAPKFIENGLGFIRNIVKGLMDALPELISRVPEIISKFANVINDNAPTILMAGVGIIMDIIEGLLKAMPTLVKTIPKIISAIIDVWSAFNWINLGKNVINFISNGFSSMIGTVKTAITSVKDNVVNVVKNLPQTFKTIGTNTIKNLGNAILSLRTWIVSNVTTFGKAIITKFKSIFSINTLKSVGKDLIKGLWNGISDMTGWIIDKVGGFAGSVIQKIKDKFDINSPSKVTQEIGVYVAQGLGVGIEEDDSAEKSIEKKVANILGIANNTDAKIKVGTSVDNLISESPLQKHQLDFNAQIDSLNDGFDRLISLVGQYLPNIADNMDRDIVLDGNSLVVGMSRRMDAQLGKISTSKGRGNV